MRTLRHSTVLIALNVGLLLAAIAIVAVAAGRLLQQLGDDQALARVMQAGATAQQAISRSEGEVLTAANLLSERPTLARLLRAHDTAALTVFLSQFRGTIHVDGCAVLLGDQLIASSMPAVSWETMNTASAGQPGSFVHAPGDGTLMLGARAVVPGVPGGVVLAVQALDARFTERVSTQAGLPVAIIARAGLEQTSPARAALRREVLASGVARAEPIDAPRAYVALHPLRTQDGRVVGLIETTLSGAGIAQSVAQLDTILVVLAIGVALLAALASLLVGQRLIARPLRALASAAARIGDGDMASSVPRLPGAEVGALASSLEEMRLRLLGLTGDLRRQRAEANAIVAGIVEGVFTVDRERRLRYLNPQAAAMLGLRPEEAIGRFCGDVLNPQGPLGMRPCAEQCPIIHARFRSGAHATEHLLLRDGTRRTMVITGSPLAEGQQVQVMRDETEVEAVRRLRDTVLANISHEFRTPLSAQLASIELLLDRLPDLPIDQIGQLVCSLQRGALRLTQLIDNLLESVRIEAGQGTLRRQAVLLDEVVEEAIDMTRPLLEQRGQAVVLDLPYPLPAIRGDASRLTQVLVNLLANANKFAPAGTAISVGGAVDATEVRLWVEDHGPGLPAVAGQALFGRFVRAPAEEPEQSGMGLGLWIVKSIVERHGGRVDAQTTPSGTRMCVTLPREEHHEDTDRRR
jgi:signal transduction histidine kinase/HAMP domain-containing protein